MPKFRKKVVSEGVYRVANPDGTRRLEAVSAARIRHWRSEIARYLANGNRLPGPFAHVDPATKKPIVFGPDGTLPRSDINAGFWENPSTENDLEMGETLIAELDAEGDENNVNTPAGKVGKTVKETSIFVVPKFTDGKGVEYNDLPLHIALVTHPIQPGQPNFEPIPQGTLALAMSQMAYMAAPPQFREPPPSADSKGAKPPKSGTEPDGDPDTPGQQPLNAGTASVESVIPLLRQCGIVLPDDTNPQNFLSYLVVALGQKSMSDGTGEGDVYEPPEGAQTKSPAPVAMSVNTPITPENFASISKEVFMSHPAAKALEETNQVLLASLTDQAKAARRARIEAFIATHPEMKDYAEKTLLPLLDGFQMSLSKSAPPSALDVALGALEAIPATAPKSGNPLLAHSLGLAMSQIPGQTPPNPFMFSAGADPNYKAETVVDTFFANTGGKPKS